MLDLFNRNNLDIIKLSSGPRYVVGAKPKLDRSKLVIGCRVAVD